MTLIRRCDFTSAECGSDGAIGCTAFIVGTDATAAKNGWQTVGDKNYCPQHNVDIFNGEQTALPCSLDSLKRDDPADRAAAQYFSHRQPETVEMELLEKAKRG